MAGFQIERCLGKANVFCIPRGFDLGPGFRQQNRDPMCTETGRI
jgi:hypothetical protein